MPDTWDEFKAERPSFEDFKAARREANNHSQSKITWSEFLAAPDDNVEWVQYWNTLASAQGSEPSSSVKLKKMAKWYKKTIDDSFDYKDVLKHADTASLTSHSTPGGNSSTTGVSTSGAVHNGDYNASQRNSSRPSTTERFASWGQNSTPPQPPSASESVAASIGPLVELTNYAKKEPLMAARFVLYAGLFFSVIPATLTDNSMRSWYFRALMIALAGSGLDIYMSPLFNRAGLLQLFSSTEMGHGFVYSTMHFFRLGNPNPFVLLPIVATAIVGFNERANDVRAPPAIRYFPRGLITANSQKILRIGSILEVSLFPVQAYLWATGNGSFISIMAYAYTYLRMRYICKASHRMIWSGIHAFIRNAQTQYRESLPAQVNEGITMAMGYLQRVVPDPLPAPPLY